MPWQGSGQWHLVSSTSVLIVFLLPLGVRCQDFEQVVPGPEQANHRGLMRAIRNSIGKELKLQVILICWRLRGS